MNKNQERIEYLEKSLQDCRDANYSEHQYDTDEKYQLDEYDIEEIARLITEAYKSGVLNNGEGKSISWKLQYEINYFNDK